MTNGQNVSDVLTGRVRQAIAAAERAVARAEVVTVAARLVKTRDTMVRRCAWCGCLALDRWTAPSLRRPSSRWRASDQTTHGICSDCLRRLERTGQTKPLTSGT